MPPEAPGAQASGSDVVNVFTPAACVTVIDWPATTAVPVLGNALVVAVSVSVRVAEPVPLDGFTTSHGTFDDADQVASSGEADSATVVLPPAAPTGQVVTARAKVGTTPACVTVTVRPAIVARAVRGCAESPRDAAVSVTVPLPVPDEGVAVSHASVDVAVQPRCSATIVTGTAWVPPAPAGDHAEIPSVAPIWVTVTTASPIVTRACREATAETGAAVSVTVPFPAPPGALTKSQSASEAAVQVNPDVRVLTVTASCAPAASGSQRTVLSETSASWALAASTLMSGCGVPPPTRESAIVVPVLCSVARMSPTLAEGRACFSTAQAPATCGAAMEVPLNSA